MLSEARLKVLVHQIEKQIPASLTDYLKDDRHRQLQAIRFPDSFLDMERLRFVIKDRHGNYNPNLIFFAIIKAMWNTHRTTKLPKSYYEKMLIKGKKLFRELNCESKLTVKLPDDFDIREIN
jgi:hypothetical protein